MIDVAIPKTASDYDLEVVPATQALPARGVYMPAFGTRRHQQLPATESGSESVTPVPDVETDTEGTKIAAVPVGALDDVGAAFLRSYKPESDRKNKQTTAYSSNHRVPIYNGEWGGLLSTGKRGWSAVPAAYRKQLRAHVGKLYSGEQGISIPGVESGMETPKPSEFKGR